MSLPSDDRMCEGCGYALRGLRDHVCPECGREFDPKAFCRRRPVRPLVGSVAAVFSVLIAANVVVESVDLARRYVAELSLARTCGTPLVGILDGLRVGMASLVVLAGAGWAVSLWARSFGSTARSGFLVALVAWLTVLVTLRLFY